MHDVHGAVDALARTLSLPDLALDGDGHAEVVFGGATPVGLVAADRHHLEFVTPLRELGAPLGRDALARLLGANYLGTATGAARLALDPDRGEVVLCGRLDVRDVDEGTLVRRLGDFLGAAAFWKGADGRAYLSGEAGADAGTPPGEAVPPSGFLLRA